jgi:hypothetical protein
MEFVSTGVFDYGHGAEVDLFFRWALRASILSSSRFGFVAFVAVFVS